MPEWEVITAYGAPTLGKFGKGQQNSNNELLTYLCSEVELAIINTYFMQSNNHYFLWIHPDQNDLI